MSLATWKAEYYPIPADQVSAEDALDHSIKKWTGALPKNRKKHGVGLWDDDGPGGVVGKNGDYLSFRRGSCALCMGDWLCSGCPGDDCFPAYLRFRETGAVRPMLDHLLAAKKRLEAGT